MTEVPGLWWSQGHAQVGGEHNCGGQGSGVLGSERSGIPGWQHPREQGWGIPGGIPEPLLLQTIGVGSC